MFQHNALLKEMNGLRRFALRLTKSGPDADDLVQATLLRALEKKDYFQDGTNLFSWTSKIMFNLFISGYRRKKKFGMQYDPVPYIEKVAVEPSQETSADLGKVRESMNLLKDEHREILILICVQGMLYEEAAQFLDIPVGTVRSRLSRARKQLQSVMMPAIDEHMPVPAQQQAPMALAA